jgi:hypothetical protein
MLDYTSDSTVFGSIDLDDLDTDAALLAPGERFIGSATTFSQPRAFDRAICGLAVATIASLSVIGLMYAGMLDFFPPALDAWPIAVVLTFISLAVLPGHMWARRRARRGTMASALPVRFRQRVVLTDQRVLVLAKSKTIDASLGLDDLRQVEMWGGTEYELPIVTLEFRDGSVWQGFPPSGDQPLELAVPVGAQYDPFHADEMSSKREKKAAKSGSGKRGGSRKKRNSAA